MNEEVLIVAILNFASALTIIIGIVIILLHKFDLNWRLNRNIKKYVKMLKRRKEIKGRPIITSYSEILYSDESKV